MRLIILFIIEIGIMMINEYQNILILYATINTIIPLTKFSELKKLLKLRIVPLRPFINKQKYFLINCQ